MPENNSNPLYQEVQKTAEDVKKTYSGMSTFRDTMQNGVVGQDNTLNSSLNNYADKVAELFAHDKSVSTSYATPETSAFGALPEGMVLNPVDKWKADADLYAIKGKETADALKTYEKRKTMLGDLVTKAVEAYKYGLEGKKDAADRAWEEYKFQETQALDWATLNESKSSSDTGDEVVDNLSDEQAIALANKIGYNFTGGTKTERMAKIRGALAEYNQTGKYNYKYLTDNLSAKVTDSLSALTDVITRSDDLTTRLNSGGNLTGPVKGRTSGALSKYLGISSDASMIGKELEEMSADKIKERYGGALTTTEVQRLTKQAITQRNVQEADNLQSLSIMKKNAVNLLREKLKSNGWSDKQIEGYITDITGSTSTTTDDRPSLSSFDK